MARIDCTSCGARYRSKVTEAALAKPCPKCGGELKKTPCSQTPPPLPGMGDNQADAVVAKGVSWGLFSLACLFVTVVTSGLVYSLIGDKFDQSTATSDAEESAHRRAKSKSDKADFRIVSKEKNSRSAGDADRPDEPPLSALDGDRVALLVGVNQYSKRHFAEKPLNFAERDIEKLAAELAKHGFEIRMLRGSDDDAAKATKTNIERTITELLADRAANDIVLMAFAGHGQQLPLLDEDGKSKLDDSGRPTEDAFFCPVDAEFRNPESLISLTHLLDQLDNKGGINLLMVDACRDNPTPDRGARSITGNELNGRLPSNTAVLFSCAAHQQALETRSAGGGHGVFFFHVLEALRGEGADPATGELTWNDVVVYVQRNVNRRAVEWFPERAARFGTERLQTPHQLTNLVQVPLLAKFEPQSPRVVKVAVPPANPPGAEAPSVPAVEPVPEISFDAIAATNPDWWSNQVHRKIVKIEDHQQKALVLGFAAALAHKSGAPDEYKRLMDRALAEAKKLTSTGVVINTLFQLCDIQIMLGDRVGATSTVDVTVSYISVQSGAYLNRMYNFALAAAKANRLGDQTRWDNFMGLAKGATGQSWEIGWARTYAYSEAGQVGEAIKAAGSSPAYWEWTYICEAAAKRGMEPQYRIARTKALEEMQSWDRSRTTSGYRLIVEADCAIGETDLAEPIAKGIPSNTDRWRALAELAKARARLGHIDQAKTTFENVGNVIQKGDAARFIAGREIESCKDKGESTFRWVDSLPNAYLQAQGLLGAAFAIQLDSSKEETAEPPASE